MDDIGQSSDGHPNGGADGGETVEIKIKTLDAQSYTLRVNKNTTVPALKDQIASVVGVPVENQRLICRGKVLKDDQLLAAYNVEDGHTLHLVARQPPQPSPPSSSSPGQEQATGPSGPSDMVIVSPQNRPGHVSHSLLMGTINIPDNGEGGMPDLNRIIAAVLNSVGIGNAVPAAIGASPGGPVAVGLLPSRARATDGHPRSMGTDTAPQAVPPAEQNELPREVEARLQIDALYGVPSTGIFTGTAATLPSNPFRMAHHPVVVPDALTTMSQYLDRLEHSFSVNEAGRGHTVLPTNQGAVQVEGNNVLGETSRASSGRGGGSAAPSLSAGPSVPSVNPVMNSDRQSSGVPVGLPAASRRLPTPSALGTIVQRVRQLLSNQAGTALSRLAVQLENEPNLLDAMAREEMQTTALRDGNMMQQLGALLLELGRATLTLRLGQSPAESVVNAGPAVFISPSGPNPMMVQSLPLQTGVALGALPSGISQAGGGIIGPSIGPRSINIHIHTSDLRLPSPSPSPSPSPQQQPPRAVIGISSGAPAFTLGQVVERPDAMNSEHALTVRQIIERAEAASGVQPANSEVNPQASSGGPVQAAIMTFNENGSMRVVPVRARSAAVSLAHPLNSGLDGGTTTAMYQPFLARFQQHVGSAQHGRPPSTANGASEASINSSGATSAGQQPPTVGPQPSVRAQVHIQAWAPPIMQALGGGSTQPVSSATPVNENRMQAPSVESQAVASDSRRDPNIQVESRVGAEGVPSGQLADGLVQGVDVDQITEVLGPILNQLVMAFQQPRTQPTDQQPSAQVRLNGPSSASGPNLEPERTSTSVPSASLGDLPANNEQSMGDGGTAPRAGHVEHSELSSDNLDDKMDVTNANEHQEDPGRSSSSSRPADQKSLEGKHAEEEGLTSGKHVEEDRFAGGQVVIEDRPVAPIGLGLGALQPIAVRSRRRSPALPNQNPITGVGASAAEGNGPPAQRSSEQILAPGSGQNLLQNLVSQLGGSSNRPQGNAMEQSLGQLTQGLLPLVGRIGSPLVAQGAEDLGDMMSQLMSRAGDGRNAGQGAFPAEMLRGMMGQLVQSPLMENLVQQVMAGVNREETQGVEHAFTGLGNDSQGVQGGFDFAGIVQQMLPVVSQMLGGRSSSSAGQQALSPANIRNHNDEGAARESPGQTNDFGRWRESLSEEEAATWSETISADVEQQRSMEPQRPFSDVYARGSPVAKRQKTEIEGAAQKLENGTGAEQLSRSEIEDNGAVQVAGSNRSINGETVSQLAQHSGGSDGMSDAYMAVLFHDLAARVAADPDFGDGTEFPHAT